MRFLGLSILILLALSTATTAVHAASQKAADPVVGFWITENKEAVVELYQCYEEICGRFAWFKDEQNGRIIRDDNNRDPSKRGRPLCQAQFMGGFVRAKRGSYPDGWVYNPNDGSTYDVTMTLQNRNTLRVRGYLLVPLLGQSQIWHRAKSMPPPCTATETP